MWLVLTIIAYGVGILLTYKSVNETHTKALHEDARKTRLRKMNIGGQVLTESDFNEPTT